MSRRFSRMRLARLNSRLKTGSGDVCSDNRHGHSRTGTSSNLSIEKIETQILTGHSEKVLNGYEVMWRQNILCDVTIIAGNSRFNAHRAFLATTADYFHDIFANGDLKDNAATEIEVTIQGVSPTTVAAILECMYTGRIQICESNVRELLAASDYLRFYGIEHGCGEFLIRRLDKRNCLRMLHLATVYRLKELCERSLVLAAENFMELAEGFDFQQLTCNQLTEILRRDELKAPSELDVFQQALGWIEHDKKSRLKYAADVLREIRLPLLSPSNIVDHVETVSFLMDIPACQELVKEALHYHCLPARQSVLQSSRTNPRSTEKIDCILATGGAPRLKVDPVCSDIRYFNPKMEKWGVVTRMKIPSHHHAVATLGGFLYVAGGEETNDQKSPMNTAFRYDPRQDVWLQICSMKHRRESFQLVALNNMLYAVGGRVDQNVSLAEVERYNPAVDRWESVAPLSSPRRSVAVAAHNGRLYAIGGSGDRRISSKVERYNPLTNQWEARRPLSTPRFFSLLTSVRSKLYLFAGATLDPSGNVVCVKTTECYTPVTDSWVTLAPMLEPRAEAGCAVLGNTIYVVGGYSWDINARLDSVECYNVEKDEWFKSSSIGKPNTGVGCCALTLYWTPALIETQEASKFVDIKDSASNSAQACASSSRSTSTTSIDNGTNREIQTSGETED